MDRNFSLNPMKGVTLIEVLITVAISGILLTTGVPALNSMSKDNGLIAAYNQITSLTSFARTEASKRNLASITLCKSTDNINCSNATTAFNVIVFTDVNQDGAIGTGEILLKSIAISHKDIKFNLSGFANNRIHFLATGLPMIIDGQTAKLMICDDRGNAHTKGMIMNLSGQVRQAQASETSCS